MRVARRNDRHARCVRFDDQGVQKRTADRSGMPCVAGAGASRRLRPIEPPLTRMDGMATTTPRQSPEQIEGAVAKVHAFYEIVQQRVVSSPCRVLPL